MVAFLIWNKTMTFVAMIIWGYWMYEIETPSIPETAQGKKTS